MRISQQMVPLSFVPPRLVVPSKEISVASVPLVAIFKHCSKDLRAATRGRAIEKAIEALQQRRIRATLDNIPVDG